MTIRTSARFSDTIHLKIKATDSSNGDLASADQPQIPLLSFVLCLKESRKLLPLRPEVFNSERGSMIAHMRGALNSYANA